MAIPTQADRDMAEIDALHGCVMTALRTQQHAAPRDLDGMRVRLRATLQGYVDAVLALARDGK